VFCPDKGQLVIGDECRNFSRRSRTLRGHLDWAGAGLLWRPEKIYLGLRGLLAMLVYWQVHDFST
jgi:hypothetical protein